MFDVSFQLAPNLSQLCLRNDTVPSGVRPATNDVNDLRSILSNFI